MLLYFYCMLLGIFPSKPLHDYHFSNAEIRYRTKKQTIEVVLKVFTDDLEKGIKKRFGLKKVALDETKAFQKEISEYILAHFEIQNAQSSTIKGTYIGKETERENATTLIYLEFPAKSFSKKWRFRNLVLVEIYADQTNNVNFLYDDESISQKSCTFRQGAGWEYFGK